MPRLNKVYYKITDLDPETSDGKPWFASSPDVMNDPQKTVDHVQRLAHQQGLSTVYELATKEEYDAYFKGV